MIINAIFNIPNQYHVMLDVFNRITPSDCKDLEITNRPYDDCASPLKILQFKIFFFFYYFLPWFHDAQFQILIFS